MNRIASVVGSLAARWRITWLLRLIRRLCPVALQANRPWRGPLYEAASGGSVACLQIVLDCGLRHNRNAIWAAAGQCFYDRRWQALDHFVSVFGVDVLRDHTVTAWWHLLDDASVSAKQRTRWLADWERLEPDSFYLWYPVLANRPL